MNSLFKHAINNLRACAHCGQMFCEINLFCKTCWSQLEREQNLAQDLRQWHYGQPTYSLYTWREQKQIHSLIYGLKNGGVTEAFEKLAVRFLSQRYQITAESYQNAIILPAPAKAREDRDHAFMWAESLSKFSGAQLVKAFEREGLAPQKRLKKQERLEKKLKLYRDLNDLSAEKFIFVDDVITTGGTAHAAFEALNKPHNFEIWTISCRPPKVLL